MGHFKPVNSQFTVAGAMALDDFERAAAAGFRAVVNFRPDGESQDQIAAIEARQAAERHGLSYVHIPASQYDVLTDDVVDVAQTAFRELSGPVLAHCASGQRAAIIWAATQARGGKPVAGIICDLKRAGFDFRFLRDDLEAQADRLRWRGPASENAHASECGSKQSNDVA
jgi:sulfide:quinone oxidoreductase